MEALTFGPLDARDLIYMITGFALFGLTLQPALARHKLFNLPLLYVLIGVAFGAFGVGLIDPLRSSVETKVIEHAAELIVIIALAGAGLAIDTPAGWRSWNPTWRLLAVTMPLTIAAVALLGVGWLGLTVPGAILLAAALAPTDPVLARSVQVAPPGQDDRTMELALTAEAGLNDGLAFPFIWLAIHAATLGAAQAWSGDAWLLDWFTFDLLYRVVAGAAVGIGTGWTLSRITFSKWGDGSRGAWNAVVVILSATLISYGVAEAVDGYGFLAVFFATRAGRSRTRGTDQEGYEKYVHHGAEQLEAILLALLLLWLGTFIGSGALRGVTLAEIGFALALVLLIRPAAGLLALWGTESDGTERRKVAFFGVRGMGSVFYIAYAQTHAGFTDIEAVWRIAALVILTSIVIHGYAANLLLEEEAFSETHPHKQGGTPSRSDGD